MRTWSWMTGSRHMSWISTTGLELLMPQFLLPMIPWLPSRYIKTNIILIWIQFNVSGLVVMKTALWCQGDQSMSIFGRMTLSTRSQPNLVLQNIFLIFLNGLIVSLMWDFIKIMNKVKLKSIYFLRMKIYFQQMMTFHFPRTSKVHVLRFLGDCTGSLCICI